MKPPKKPSKEPPLPTQDESRRTNVLFEKLMSEFRTVGEAVSAVRERVDRIEPKLDKLTEKVDVLESAVRSHSGDIRALKEAVHGNTAAIQGNTEVIQSIRADLKKYNQRLELVEAKIPS